jgi:hypothetical protein
MAKVANIEGLTARKTGKTTRTWYYRLAVPKADQKRAGRKDIWVSLRTSDKGMAITALPNAIKRAQAELAASLSAAPPSATASSRPVDTVRQLSKKVSELQYRSIMERDFIDRADLFEKASADERAFFGGSIVGLPETPYFDMLLEDGETPLSTCLAYYWWYCHGQRIAQLRFALEAGDPSQGLKDLDLHLATLNQTASDKSVRLFLSRAIMTAEIDALNRHFHL